MRCHSRPLFALAVLVAAACGSDTSPRLRGPARMAIVSGNDQHTQVAAPALPKPVVGQLVRQPNGQVAFRWLDAVLPAKAYAQTVVTGAPITGAVVCWANVPGAPRLIPFSICTSTNDSGKAVFNLRPDTVAGHAKGQVHWDSAGTPIVTDSVQASVAPGPLTMWGYCGGTCPGVSFTPAVGDTLHLVGFLAGTMDQYRNPVPADTIVAHTRVRWAWAAVDNAARPYQCVMPTAPTDSGWTAVVPNVTGSRCLLMWIGGTDTVNFGVSLGVHL